MTHDPEPIARPETVDFLPVRRDQPMEFEGRVNRLGFREGLVVAMAMVLLLTGLGVVAIGPPGPQPSGSVRPAVAFGSPTAGTGPTPVASPTIGPTTTVSPGRTPAVTPAGHCAPLPPTAGIPFVTLLSGTDRVVGSNLGDAWLSEAPPPGETWSVADASVPLAEPVILSIGYIACALEWRISIDRVVVQEQTNPGLDPAYASQGYFVVTMPPTVRSTVLLRIDVHFATGWSAAAWSVSVEPTPIPQAFLASLADSVAAVPGCGFTIRLRNGAKGSETCETNLPSETATLFVGPGAAVAFRVPHASFNATNEATITCGRAVGSPPVLQVDPACDLDWAYDATEQFGFLAPSNGGVWLVEIDGCARRDVGEACGPWFVTLDTKHPRPSDSGIVD